MVTFSRAERADVGSRIWNIDISVPARMSLLRSLWRRRA
jgi:hypothetical protein